MFVKKTRVMRGNRRYTYLSVVETVRENGRPVHRTLLRLGEVEALRSSGELDRIVQALNEHLDRRWYRTADVEVGENAPSVGVVAAVRAYWERLGLESHFASVGAGLSWSLSDAVFAMVANRLAAPGSKRRILTEWLDDVVMPDTFSAPSLHQYYRALDYVTACKEATEDVLYSRLTDLTNLDMRLVCYDLTSTYFETHVGPVGEFPSRAFGYSRDHRSDRPQVMLGVVTTGNGIPIAHHVFPGNTGDSTTLPEVLDSVAHRFAVGRVCIVADRGLITSENLAAITAAGHDYIMATRLHRDPTARAALKTSTAPDTVWIPAPDASSAVCETAVDTTRCVVVANVDRYWRDTVRRQRLVQATEEQLLNLERRVRAGRLKDSRKIAGRASRILNDNPVARLLTTEIGPAHFIFDYNHDALDYEELLAGRWILTTNLPQTTLSASGVLTAYRGLLNVEHRFRVLKDFLALRPVYHWTEQRVRGHVAICMIASLIETLIEKDLAAAQPEAVG